MFFKVLHLFLALNILLSSTGITAYEHLCLMKGRTSSLFVQPNHCCKKKETPKSTCHKTKCCKKAEKSTPLGISAKPCCTDKATYFEADLNGTAFKTVPASGIDFQPTFCGAEYAQSGVDLIPLNQKILRFYLYKPPPLAADIRVLVQSFLC